MFSGKSRQLNSRIWRMWWPLDHGIDPPLALIVVLLRVSVDHLGVDQHPHEARAEGDQRLKRADCCQARLPRLCWSDLILLCWRIFGDIFSTGGCNGCLNLDNPSNFGLEDLVDELETLYQDEGYSSLISRWTLIYIEAYNLTQPCTKQGRFLGACWHRCRWQGHRERQRGLRLRRLRRSRLWPHFPMGTSSRCSGIRSLKWTNLWLYRIAVPHLTQRMMWAFPAAYWTIRGSWTSLLKVTLNCLESKQAKNIIFLPQSLALMRTRPLHCWEHIRLVRLAKKQKKGNLGFVAWSGM